MLSFENTEKHVFPARHTVFTESKGEECEEKDTFEVSVSGSNMCSQELSFAFSFKRRKSQYLVDFPHNNYECKC